MSDPIVEEVRKARDEYARQFNYDIDAICADLRRREQESGAILVTLPKRAPIAPTIVSEQAPAESPVNR